MEPLIPFRSDEPAERDAVAVLVLGRDTVLLTVEEARNLAAQLVALADEVEGCGPYSEGDYLANKIIADNEDHD